jgi:hypothetical protein
MKVGIGTAAVAVQQVAVQQPAAQQLTVEARAAAPAGELDPVEALRRRMASRSAREHVVLDFLSDDLREVREALGHVQAYVQGIERAMADPRLTQQQLLALALGGGPTEQLDYLGEMLANTRRRLAQVAARM